MSERMNHREFHSKQAGSPRHAHSLNLFVSGIRHVRALSKRLHASKVARRRYLYQRIGVRLVAVGHARARAKVYSAGHGSLPAEAGLVHRIVEGVLRLQSRQLLLCAVEARIRKTELLRFG